MEIKNAKITSTMLGYENHGFLTFKIEFIYENGTRHFGEYDLSACNVGRIFVSPKGLEAISKILEVTGVGSWEELPGTYIRFKDNGYGKEVEEIGNIIEDDWFNIAKFFGGEE